MYNGFFEKLHKDRHLQIKEVNFYEGKYAVFYDKLLRDYNDIEIYIRQASMCGNKVLELACGAGRVGLPLAEAGFQVFGIDITTDMLDLYYAKIYRLPKRIQRRITLFQGDITDFKIDDKFDLILFPATTICLFNDKQILKIFEIAYEHLNDKGRFIFDRAVINSEHYFNHIGLPMFMSWNDIGNVHNIAWFQEFILPGGTEIEADIYCESIDEDGSTQRFLGYTQKRIITDEVIDKALSSSSFKCLERLQLSEEHQKIEFYIWEKR